MDYSLLVGISKFNTFEQKSELKPRSASLSASTSSSHSHTSLRKMPSHVFFLEDSEEIVVKKRRGSQPVKKSKKGGLKKVNNTPPLGEAKLCGGIFPSPLKSETYVMGVIDIFQEYDNKKKLAHFAKSTLTRKPSVLFEFF
jgi:hypothetical protein